MKRFAVIIADSTPCDPLLFNSFREADAARRRFCESKNPPAAIGVYQRISLNMPRSRRWVALNRVSEGEK